MVSDNIKYRPILFVIIILALGLRLLHLIFWRSTPYWDGYFLDELYHHLWAKRISTGEILPVGVFFRAPLYPYILGAIYSLFGDNGLVPRIFQHLWGILTIIPFWWISRRILQKSRWAILATLLWAINPIQIFYESRLLLDSFFSAGIVWLIFLLLLIRKKRTDWIVFACGIWIGILAIIRPTVLVLLPVIVIWMWRYIRWRALIFILAICIPIAPITISNYLNGDLVLIASQGGINFYIGNNSSSDGASAIVPEFGWNWKYTQCVKLAEEETGEELTPSQVSKFYFNRGLKFWSDNFLDAMKLTGKKMLLLFGAPEIGNNGNIYFLTKHSILFWLIVIGLGWGFLIPFAIIGIFSRNYTNRALLVGMLILYSATIVSFFVCSRFRLPIIPIISILTVSGIETVLDKIRQRKFFVPILAVIIGILVYTDYFDWRRFDDSLSHFSLGNIHLRTGRNELAKLEYFRSLNMNPHSRGVHLNLGVLYFRQGDIDSAMVHFRREVQVNGELCRALSNLGVIYRIRRDYETAILYGKRALEHCPYDLSVIYNYAYSLYSAGEYNKADSLLFELCEDFRWDPRILNLWGAVSLALGDTAAAEELFRDVINIEKIEFIQEYDIGTIYSEQADVGATPAGIKSRAYYNLGQIKMVSANPDRAIQYYNLSIAMDSIFAPSWFALGAIELARNNLINAEKKFIKADNLGLKIPELYFNLASVKARLGDYDGAVEYLHRTLEIQPDFELAQEALNELEKMLPHSPQN